MRHIQLCALDEISTRAARYYSVHECVVTIRYAMYAMHNALTYPTSWFGGTLEKPWG